MSTQKVSLDMLQQEVIDAIEDGPGAAVWGSITGDITDQADLQAALAAAGGSSDWGDIGGTLSDQTDLQAALDAKQALDPDLTSWAAVTRGTGFDTAAAVNVGSAGAFVTNGGTLGTPSGGTLTNCTGLPVASGISGLGTGVATWLATPSSANLRSLLTDETGTGAAVFADSPTLTTPNIGAATTSALSSASTIDINAATGLNLQYNAVNRIRLRSTTTEVTQSTASTSTTTGALTVVGGVGIGGAVFVGGNLTASGYVKTGVYTVATLPAAATAGNGARAQVTDANSTTFLSTVAGGGANIVPVVSNGTNWLIG